MEFFGGIMSLAGLFLAACVGRVSSMFVSRAPPAVVPALTEGHLQAARRCKAIYSDAAEKSEGFFASKDSGAQATVTVDGSEAIVCFRGSDSVTDWYTNLRLCKVPFLSRKHKNPDLEVHSGFFLGHNSVKDKIYARLNEIVESGACDRILFVGHSAGATLAKLSAFDYTNARGLKVEVVTFGSPKIGNAAFARSFDASVACTRIVNDSDGIALAPLFGGYHHVGDLIRLENCAPPNPVSLRDALLHFGRLDAVEDHGIDAYVAAIELALKKSN